MLKCDKKKSSLWLRAEWCCAGFPCINGACKRTLYAIRLAGLSALSGSLRMVVGLRGYTHTINVGALPRVMLVPRLNEPLNLMSHCTLLSRGMNLNRISKGIYSPLVHSQACLSSHTTFSSYVPRTHDSQLGLIGKPRSQLGIMSITSNFDWAK